MRAMPPYVAIRMGCHHMLKEPSMKSINTVSSMSSCTAYRVFISYSHDDHDIFERLKTALEARPFKLLVLSDRNIGAGSPFTDAIKGLIIHAHLFIPLITKNSKKRPWVHQETGFAMAHNIPILPIVLKGAGVPPK